MKGMESLLTAREAARLLRINRFLVYQLAREGELPVVRINRLVRFRPEDLRDWVEQRRSA